MKCCSVVCEKAKDCANHCTNTKGFHQIEDLYSFGYGNLSNEGYIEGYLCGEKGDWKMFEPIKKNRPTEDCLIVGFDSAPNGDDTILTVARVKNGKTYIENMFRNQDALDIYDYLVGSKRLKEL